MATDSGIFGRIAPRKFGKKAARFDKRTLKLGRYVLGTPPLYIQWHRGFNIPWGMLLNDQLGCCVEAAKGHAIQTLSLDNGRLVTVPDSVVLSNYEATGGYVPGDQSTDNGEDELTSLKAWRTSGFGGHKLLAFADPDPNNTLHVAQSIWLLGGCFIGFRVPTSFIDQFDSGKVIDLIPGDTDSGEGHAVWLCGMDFVSALPTFTFISWSEIRKMTVRAFLKWTDESHGLVVDSWLNAKGLSPGNFNLTQLEADLGIVTG